MKINIPNDWQGVTLREFQAITQLFKEADTSNDVKTYELECALISTLSGEDMDEIMSLTRSSHNHIMNQLDFLSSPVEAKIRTRAKVNGRRYYFEKNARKITGGQWVTIMHFLEDEEKVDANLHNLLACFAYPIKWFRAKYVPEAHNQIAEDMLDLPVTFVKPLTDFFLSDYQRYVMRSLAYLEMSARGLKRKAEKELARSSHVTDGSTQSTDLQTEDMTLDRTT